MGLFGFGKKETKKTSVKGAYVKVLGSGCKKCIELEENVVAALQMLGKEPDVEHVTDFAEIAAYGVMTTPALVLGNKVVSSGRILKTEDVLEILKKDEEK
ncbi:MAG: thioredoxin family protein [Anaerotignum sp.]